MNKLRYALWVALERVEGRPEPTEEELEKMRRAKLKFDRERVKEKRMRSMDKRDRKNLDW